ncbi:hypothetical protein F4781DRAFT_388062 [Annulohypoxylon bovei var. microspora]|nr:hypothetical protein F4781DRAFT_388062 [Annulohypoxylon bovei var. microspora]
MLMVCFLVPLRTLESFFLPSGTDRHQPQPSPSIIPKTQPPMAQTTTTPANAQLTTALSPNFSIFDAHCGLSIDITA